MVYEEKRIVGDEMDVYCIEVASSEVIAAVIGRNLRGIPGSEVIQNEEG